jgi:hypothetical protein
MLELVEGDEKMSQEKKEFSLTEFWEEKGGLQGLANIFISYVQRKPSEIVEKAIVGYGERFTRQYTKTLVETLMEVGAISPQKVSGDASMTPEQGKGPEYKKGGENDEC